MRVKNPARTKAKADNAVMRENTAKDWRGSSSKKAKKKAAGPPRSGTAKDLRKVVAKEAKKEAAGSLRSGTAQDWRNAGAKKSTGKSTSPKRKTERMRGAPSRD